MTDHFEMRRQLQRVAAYRELCRYVRRSGRGNILFASFMLLMAYLLWDAAGQPAAVPVSMIVIAGLATGELLVGLYKWVAPSAECVLLDGIVLLAFVGYYAFAQFERVQAGNPVSPVAVVFAAYMLTGAVGRFKAYGQLRRMFAERPTPEHMAWFDELVHEIRAADPQGDELALDLPTNPHWKAKLFGPTAFFVSLKDGSVWVAVSEDFEILREKRDRGTGRRRALLRAFGRPFPEFEIADATWANYQKWRAAHPASISPPTAVGGPG